MRRPGTHQRDPERAGGAAGGTGDLSSVDQKMGFESESIDGSIEFLDV